MIGPAAVLAAALLAAAGCGSSPAGGLSVTPGPNAVVSRVSAEEGTPGPSGQASGAGTSGAGTSPAAASDLQSPVHGIVLHLRSPSHGKVTSFTLLTDDNRQVTFTVGIIEDAAAFPAAHSTECRAAPQPVLVCLLPSAGLEPSGVPP